MDSARWVAALQRLESSFPKLERSDVNERTLLVWRRVWVDRVPVDDLAVELGWSRPAVAWHLRRAARVLRPR